MMLRSLKALCFGLVPLWCLTAQAASVTFDLKDGNRDTGWIIRYDDTVVQNPVFTGIAGMGNLQGTLLIDKVFNSLAPIEISFEETEDEVAKADNFGLRINLSENVHNLSGTDWTDFHFLLIDNTVVSPQDEAAHPGFAHFHPAGLSTPPFSVVGGNGPGMNAKDSFTLAGGVFSNNSAQAWSGIGIHQWEDQGFARDFILRETPSVPLPPAAWSGLALMSAMGLMTAFAKRDRQAIATGRVWLAV